jgi:hypothetical protein
MESRVPAHARHLCLVLLLVAVAVRAGPRADPDADGRTVFLRGAVQAGEVLETNDFLGGDNQSGEPVDSFRSVRLEIGWQTDGSRDWHHVYNFPTYGLGLYGADFDNDEELGTPTSLYGFFTWPFLRSGRWTGEFLLAFGLTNDWKPYDPVENPKNIAIGLGRSVHIEPGATIAYRVARRWSLIGGVTATHFSNGGTQRPNHGINQVGPILYVQHETDDPVALPVRREGLTYRRSWDFTITGSAGKRNLDLPLEDPDLRERYGNQSYAIANVTVGAAYRVSFKSRLAFGLDFCYDETVGDLMRIDAFNEGTSADPTLTDHLELGVFGGYEIFAHRTHAILHLGYKVATKDVPDRLPRFYQRLGIRQFVYQDLFAGLNVRFHELGSADNLEWVVGYQFHR